MAQAPIHLAAALDGADWHLVPARLDDVAAVVPLPQERGVFRTALTASTLRGNLGLGSARTRDGCRRDR